MIRVLVIDDNAIFRQGMRQLIDSIPDLEVSAVAGDGAAGVDAALALQVDIVLMDLAMPGLSGIEATRKLAAAAPHIGIVAMTMLEDDDMIVQALRAGARGYVVKGADTEDVLRASGYSDDEIASLIEAGAVAGPAVGAQGSFMA